MHEEEDGDLVNDNGFSLIFYFLGRWEEEQWQWCLVTLCHGSNNKFRLVINITLRY